MPKIKERLSIKRKMGAESWRLVCDDLTAKLT